MIDYVALLPEEPPEDLTKWIVQQGMLDKTYLIYRAAWEYEPLENRKRPVVKVVCSDCGTTFTAEKIEAGGCHSSGWSAPFGWQNWNQENENVISGMETVCPVCGFAGRTMHVGNISSAGIEDYAYTAQVCRIKTPDQTDRLAVVEWQTRKVTEKTGDVHFHHRLWTAWVVEEKKIVRIMGYIRMNRGYKPQKPEQRKRYLDYFEAAQLIYPFDPSILEGTTGENCKLDWYIGAGGKWLVSYLALWRKRPAVENLVVQGYGKLVEQMIEAEMETYSPYGQKKGCPKLERVDWTQKKPNRMLHMEKEAFRKYAGKLTYAQYKIMLWAKEHATAAPAGGIETLWHWGGVYGVEHILEIAGEKDFWRCVKYLDKQKDRNVYELRDYWEMARGLDMDLDNEQVRWPKNLRRAHDNAMRRQKENEDKEMVQKFQQRKTELERYAWSNGGILIRPCGDQVELNREGKELCHCVATYAKRHAEGKTAIFFLRRAEEPDKPWYTLELDETNLVVRQNRGLRNCGRTPEVTAFEQAWLEWLKAGRGKKKKGDSAA